MSNTNQQNISVTIQNPGRKLIINPSLRIFYFKAMESQPGSHSSVIKEH